MSTCGMIDIGGNAVSRLDRVDCLQHYVSRMAIALSLFVVVGGARGDTPEPAETRALGRIFAESHVVNAALDIHEQAMLLPPKERFDLLSRWVLPNDSHATLRLNVGFSPTYPVPTEHQKPAMAGKRMASGGQIVCPAMDLIDTAMQLDRLTDVREAIQSIEPFSRLEWKKLCAFRCLLDLAANNTEAAVVACAEFLEYTTDSDPHDIQHRSDELLLLTRASAISELRDVLLDYVRSVLTPGRWPTYHDAWSRHFAKFSFRMTPAIPEDRTSQTLRDMPQVSKSLQTWTPISLPLAARRGPGMPTADWVLTPPQAINVTNHGDDVVYFNVPLLGDLTVEADATVSNWREAEMIVGARWVAPSYTANSCDIGTPRRTLQHFELDQPSTRRSAHWYRHRTAINGRQAVTSLDGHIVHRETFPQVRDPWIGVRSRQLNEGGAKNVRISGPAVIPETIDLIGPGLDSWIDYYATDEPWAQLVWGLDNGEISGQQLPTEYKGTICEKALFYHRPMLEDGSIDYEFYYAPNAECAHPAIDRLCFVMKEDHVRLHWLTDGAYEQTAADPGNLTTGKTRSSPVPLIANAWNRMQVNLRGDIVQLVLNGEQIAEQKLAATNQRFFGLYYLADQQQLRVRNIHWHGAWPRTLPTPPAGELAGSDTDFLDKRTDHLQAIFRHNFSEQGLPSTLFRVSSGRWGEDVTLTPEGLHTQALTSRLTSVSLNQIVSGDFDIFARYTGFQGASEGGGARLMTRLQNAQLREVTAGRKQLIQDDGTKENIGFLWHGFYNGGVYRLEADTGRNIEETAGTIRLSRRGSTIYVLTAEQGSDQYRLHMSQEAGTEDLSPGGIQLQSEMPGMSVVWTDVEIHAEAIQNSQQIIAGLNRTREHIPESNTLDFTTSAHDEFHSNARGLTWIPGTGLKLRHAGSMNDWATFMRMSGPLVGDFDVTCDLNIESFSQPEPGDISMLAFQIEFPDDIRTRYQAALIQESNGVSRLAVQHQCHASTTGRDETVESQAVTVKSLRSLRIAVRGEHVTIVGTSDELGENWVLAQFQRPPETGPVGLNVFAHAGGPDAEVAVVLKKLQIHHDGGEPPKKIGNWGLLHDMATGSQVEFDSRTLTITAPDIYVDNYPPGAFNAPRVMQDVLGDFTAQVDVIHLDESLPDSVHKGLGDFPTAYHAGTLLLRHNNSNCVRLERVSTCREGNSATTCLIQIWKEKKLSFYRAFPIEDKSTRMKLERRGKKLNAAFSQDEGKTWTEFPEQPFEDFPEQLAVGLSLTSNTEKGCKVQFADLVLDGSSDQKRPVSD